MDTVVTEYQTTVAAVTINVAYKLKDMFTCLPVEKSKHMDQREIYNF